MCSLYFLIGSRMISDENFFLFKSLTGVCVHWLAKPQN